MANFTAKDVQALRQQTGVGMMECKKALTEANGDMEKAAILLREKGLAAADKKADRIAAEGLVATLVKDDTAVIVEVNAETDFVAKNQDFVNFVDAIANTVMDTAPADIDTLKASKLHGSNDTVEEALREKILVIGENMNVRRFHRTNGAVVSYLHGGGRIGVIVRFDADPSVMANEKFQEVAKDVAMQIAAIAPKYIGKKDVPADEVAAEKAFLTEQVVKEGKPEHIAEKIVEGRIGKFYEAICLEEQAFVKDGSMTVAEYLKQASKEIGTDLKVVEFVRYEVGEGLEKREENFADEIASMVK